MISNLRKYSTIDLSIYTTWIVTVTVTVTVMTKGIINTSGSCMTKKTVAANEIKAD